ncbi:MAG TPA: hypothetical protein VJA27_01705 [Patescibacteria group bacterium]|uniref:Small-conductance mechanosensitive ion channel n=1 Tax=Candidatus Sungbacteria bacterium RIFCSPHIGHO2_02_FULL_47_11 TaxID=1802270 RepID=A0A1G2KLN5_9BACT|nr:MAG: hypothetical protein A3C07_03715 [Candidatus Sungbacteria bacterium RIFCSPHIGHO2_02_FULL_47_11]HLD60826.1 hypothetical protein [Patescibacteria group bacterium]
MTLILWGDVIRDSLQEVWIVVATFLPLLIGAIIVFVIGWIIAVALGKLVEQIVRALRVDMLLSKLDVEQAIERAGWKLNSGAFVGGLVKWFFIVVALLVAVNVLGLSEVSDFLRDVLVYIPNVIVAALILIIAAIVADFTERLVRGSVEAAGYKGSLVGVVARWSIWIFAIFAVLLQLRIAEVIVQTLITGLVYGIALAFAIAFGVGGKEAAADILHRVKEELKK